MRAHRDLEAAAIAACVCALGALLVPVDAVRLAFALPLTMLLPGYGIAAAALAGRKVERPQMLLIGIGLSLAVLALGGLLLNYLGGLRAGPWALLLALVVLGSCRAAALRRRPATQPEIRRPPRRRPSLGAIGFVLGGLAATAAALVLAFTPVAAKHAVGYSELWLRPFDHGGTTGVRVGVGNEEHDLVGYGVIAKFGNGRRLVTRRFALEPGQRHVVVVPSDRQNASKPERVAVTLYREGEPNVPYRRVSGWVPAGGPGA